MNRDKKEELLRRFLDGDLSGKEERDTLRMIADDPELRQMLRFEQQIADHFGGMEREAASYRVPDKFTDQVMQSIEELESVTDTQTSSRIAEDEGLTGESPVSEQPSIRRLAREWGGAIAAFLEFLWNPRSVSMRPAWGVAFLLVAGVLWGVYSSTELVREGVVPGHEETLATEVVSEEEEEVWIRFVYIDPEASEVAVAGDFTNWEPVDLTSDTVSGQRVWTGMIRVPRGEQHYMFVRNGEEWVTDPFADTRRDDGFGNENAVLYL